MVYYTIKTPIWDGDKVGIADHRVAVDDLIEVKIDYKDQHGNLVHPHLYVMHTRALRKYPTKMVKGTLLHIVPINDFRWARRKD